MHIMEYLLLSNKMEYIFDTCNNREYHYAKVKEDKLKKNVYYTIVFI